MKKSQRGSALVIGLVVLGVVALADMMQVLAAPAGGIFPWISIVEPAPGLGQKFIRYDKIQNHVMRITVQKADDSVSYICYDMRSRAHYGYPCDKSGVRL